MLKVKWTNKVKNTTILRRVGKSSFELLLTINDRKMRYRGHNMLRGSSGKLFYIMDREIH